MGKILDLDEISHHNSRSDLDYECGIEGPQFVELPDGRILMNATSFLPNDKRGSRQRAFFAVADKIQVQGTQHRWRYGVIRGEMLAEDVKPETVAAKPPRDHTFRGACGFDVALPQQGFARPGIRRLAVGPY